MQNWLADPLVLYSIGSALLGALLGLLIGLLMRGPAIRRLETANAVLSEKLKNEEALAEERKAALDLALERLANSFDQLADKSLQANSENFLRLAREHLGKHQAVAQSELSEREKAIQNLVKPIAEALNKTEKQILEMEKARQHAFGNIDQQLKSMTEGQHKLQTETRNLVNALRRPQVRGQWGEMTLRRLAELAGMVEHCDFYEQETSGKGDSLQRPDMLIRMPDERVLVVDVKTPLDAYLAAMEATDETVREAELDRHARHVRERVSELAKKAYWDQFARSPEFVILFIPGEQFLAAALDRLPDLQEKAMQQKVLLATPTSFVGLLKVVAYGWRQISLAENAERIRDLGEELYGRLATFGNHLAKVGRQLGGSIDAFNAAVGSLERSVLPSARRFVEMGVQSRSEVPELQPLEKAPRKLAEPVDSED